MTTSVGEIYEFGAFTLDPAERLLLLRGRPLRLTPKTFDLLVTLARIRWAEKDWTVVEFLSVSPEDQMRLQRLCSWQLSLRLWDEEEALLSASVRM